jgi:hypothetical protein
MVWSVVHFQFHMFHTGYSMPLHLSGGCPHPRKIDQAVSNFSILPGMSVFTDWFSASSRGSHIGPIPWVFRSTAVAAISFQNYRDR